MAILPAFSDTVPTKGCDAYDHRPADRPEAKRGRIVPRDTGRGAGRFPAVHLQVGIGYRPAGDRQAGGPQPPVRCDRRLAVRSGGSAGDALCPGQRRIDGRPVENGGGDHGAVSRRPNRPEAPEEMALCAGSADGAVCRPPRLSEH